MANEWKNFGARLRTTKMATARIICQVTMGTALAAHFRTLSVRTVFRLTRPASSRASSWCAEERIHVAC